MAWVWEHGPASAVDRLVLLALADFCDDAGNCWPSMERIGSKAGMTGRGARNVVRRLQDEGWISVDVGGGRGGCSRYRVHTVASVKSEPDTGNEIPGREYPEREVHKPGTPRHETRNLRSAEPSRTIIEPSKSNPPTPPNDEFEGVWAHYPRKVGKGKARKAWLSARRKAGYDEITKPLGQFIRAVRGAAVDKIPHFATWLNEERWQDEQSHARNGPRSSTDDLRGLATISATDDLARLWAPSSERKAIGQ